VFVPGWLSLTKAKALQFTQLRPRPAKGIEQPTLRRKRGAAESGSCSLWLSSSRVLLAPGAWPVLGHGGGAPAQHCQQGGDRVRLIGPLNSCSRFVVAQACQVAEFEL